VLCVVFSALKIAPDCPLTPMGELAQSAGDSISAEGSGHPGLPSEESVFAEMTVSVTAIHIQVTETMSTKTPDVPTVSRTGGNGAPALIDSAELAERWRVPESWIRNRTRARTPKEERIPCVRLGRYVRFEWGSPRLQNWLEKKRQ